MFPPCCGALLVRCPVTFRPDLAAYFDRIGYRGSPAADLTTLGALSAAHVRTIPFEALDVLLGHPVDIDPAAIERKFLERGRGGYCFEQNTYFLHVLTALGFEVTPISGRVRSGRPRDYTPARTHVFLRVELAGQSYLADVGIGALSLTSPIRLLLDEPQATAHETRRLIAEGSWEGLCRRSPEAVLYHQALLGDTWTDVCELTLEPMPVIDREVGNWYTSAHPGSHFKNRLLVARSTEAGRLTLLNRELTRRGHDGVADTTVIGSPDELLEVLEREFGLRLPAGTRFPCPGLVWD